MSNISLKKRGRERYAQKNSKATSAKEFGKVTKKVGSRASCRKREGRTKKEYDWLGKWGLKKRF